MTEVVNKKTLYSEIEMLAKGLLFEEHDIVANTANISALLFQHLPKVNWCGFYFVKQNQLVLGPFQGKPACIRIPVGRGVCGTAVETATTQIVADVHQFDGHIACDVDSQSEIVLPIIVKSEVIAVLDIDSPSLNRFDQEDKKGLEKIVNLLRATIP
jgi:L-methionine (R)-S-oxide reductase